MTTLLRNIAALETVSPELATQLLQESPSDELATLTTRDGHRSFRLTDSDGGKALHSRYAPMREAEKIADSLNTRAGNSAPATLILLGLGGGFLAHAGIQRLSGTTILVVERSPQVLRRILQEVDLSREILTGRLFFALDPAEAATTLEMIHVPAIRDGLQTIPLQAWTDHPRNRDHFRACLAAIQKKLQALAQDTLTIGTFSRRWLSHTLHNSYRFHSSSRGTSSSWERLRRSTAGEQLVVLAAGPSLEPWLDTLTSLPRTKLLATDTALPALLQRGIIPAGVVLLDPQTWSLLHLRQTLPEETWLLADAGAAPAAACRTTGDHLVWYCGNHPLHHLLLRAGASVTPLPYPPESVTEAAVLLARLLGASRVEVAGSDGGFPRGKTYCRGTYHYHLAHRSSRRLLPEEHFFAHRVYPAATPSPRSRDHTPRDRPFFSTPAMASRTGRIARARNISRDLPLASPALPSPPEEFSAHRFWKLHLRELATVIERLQALGREATIPAPVLLEALGHHGRAHLPLLLRRQRPLPEEHHLRPDSFPTLDHPALSRSSIVEELEKIRGFILEESNRYSLMR
ncbi:Protein of unknown function DUF115 [Alkalispirochaeta americana]|uniref:6-hydroxymethylpterin diphosphokinase MptE-like domain-containing protein n=2 Tax=Alkalispirochaeta americana TaxID=159291 RepID=A0A1N6VKR8_9SPIO|nr:Protein of unknown function DUF115 [Alkalispirochaeta americana]